MSFKAKSFTFSRVLTGDDDDDAFFCKNTKFWQDNFSMFYPLIRLNNITIFDLFFL